MRYPNLRYGNPAELNYYAMGIPLPILARRLRRDERTVRDWLSAKTRVPWWVPEVLRLQQMEARDIVRQHMQHKASWRATGRPLATVTPAGELERRRQDVKKPQPLKALRLELAPAQFVAEHSPRTGGAGIGSWSRHEHMATRDRAVVCTNSTTSSCACGRCHQHDAAAYASS